MSELTNSVIVSEAGVVVPALRRQFRLPEGDEEFLQGSRLHWETLLEGGFHWLLLREYPLPTGYNCPSVDVAIQITPGYPVSALDMAYFYPNLSRLDGKPIGGLSLQTIDARSFQRWSRHRSGENPWRIEVDDISTHLAMVDDWLEREFSLR